MTRTIVSAHGITKAWWKGATVYQIYPSSFCDSNGDGVGDLGGITSKLDYLKDLGVDVVWLCPIFKSPQLDMGYDISDYKDVHAPYGSVADVDKLIAELHARGMKLVLDLVVNHSSDEHPWFIESKSSKDSPKRDWYIWRPAKYDSDGNRHPPNNWRASLGGGSVWEWDEGTQEYYLHYYVAEQPDLNWENPAVREAVYDLMKFWLDKGCDGYRMDVIGRISKDTTFPDAPVIDPTAKWQEFGRKPGPRVHEFLQEMHKEVLSKYDVLTVGEFNQIDFTTMLKFVHPSRNELQMGFNFDHVNIGLSPSERYLIQPWELKELKAILARWQSFRETGAWHASYLENHDQPRSISRYANDSPEWRVASGKLLAMMHATMFGTLYVYQGQEIGMINLPNTWPLEEWKDVQTQNVVTAIRKAGIDVEAKTKLAYVKARDNARSPMQWSADPGAGFSSAEPWMRIPDDHKVCNVASQLEDADSVLSFWRQIIKFRKDHEDDLVYGNFTHLSPEDNEVFAYVRANSLLVALNFTDHQVAYQPPISVKGATLLKSTAPAAEACLEDTVVLSPYQGVVYQLTV